ncbi:hypothetical protein Anas_05846 [Armadillidium nasatum]|uniref:Uncharacterized protein n=1 Tax=Armadillidium nasatum TaxID=96803 RepID=A0A5N5T372_9CRUS|nr:hypothetical protein Anas_05846 [Armadillidium nasatum]
MFQEWKIFPLKSLRRLKRNVILLILKLLKVVSIAIPQTLKKKQIIILPLMLLSEAFDENNQNSNELLLQLIEEQKLLEQKLEQEKQDRQFALQLQKSFKKVDRSKGSEDEYSLRNQKRTFKKSSSGSHSKQRTPDSSKKNTLRQTTLMESLTKKQRRV